MLEFLVQQLGRKRGGTQGIQLDSQSPRGLVQDKGTCARGQAKCYTQPQIHAEPCKGIPCPTPSPKSSIPGHTERYPCLPPIFTDLGKQSHAHPASCTKRQATHSDVHKTHQGGTMGYKGQKYGSSYHARAGSGSGH